jgi:hypothetical protein
VSDSEHGTQEFAIPSILDLVVDRSTLPWTRLVVGFGLLLALLPLLAALAEGILWQALVQGIWATQGEWRVFLSLPVGIVYLLLTINNLAYLRMDVVTPLRPLIQLDEAQYNEMFEDATRVKPRQELVALALGPLIAFAMFFSDPPPLHYTTYWIFMFEAALGYSLFSWIVYRFIINTRLIAVLHAQPMQVDIFNIEPFESVGRHSLRFTATFLGAVALSAIFLVSREAMFAPQFWVAYTLLILIPVALFFLSLRPTHRVLGDAKRWELNTVNQQIAHAYRTLTHRKAEGEDVTAIAQESNAWIAYQEEIKKTRTWPYNTETLNTLAISVMIPVSAGLVKVLGPLLLRSG